MKRESKLKKLKEKEDLKSIELNKRELDLKERHKFLNISKDKKKRGKREKLKLSLQELHMSKEWNKRSSTEKLKSNNIDKINKEFKMKENLSLKLQDWKEKSNLKSIDSSKKKQEKSII